jgi:hypothetical protein
MKKVFTEADLNNMPVDPLTNKPFVWVIDGDCLYDETVPIDLQPIFEDHDEVLDVSE